VRRTLADEAATRAFARELAERLPPGALLLLDGPLGAGKTTLIAALVAALGGPERVSSPTYTLIHEYPTPQGPIVHVDAYRLGHPDALEGFGLDEYLERARLVAVEWGGALAERRPDAWRLRLDRSPDAPDARSAELTPPHG
jgi:tRNA threonylcarbamoyladenosine biosynthesis protein TsaE